jgi:hypothetical protein
MDLFYFVPFLREPSLALLPDDSHGKMNLDSPKQGPRFAYARAAAVKRTRYEFELLEKILTPEMLAILKINPENIEVELGISREKIKGIIKSWIQKLNLMNQ